MPFTIRPFAIFVVMFLGTSLSVDAQEPYFPELVFFPKDKELNSIVDDMTQGGGFHPGRQRRNRRSGNCPRRLPDLATVYRFLWLAAGQHPICMRLTRNDGVFVIHVTQHDGPPGLTAGRLTLSKDVKLGVQESETLVARLQKTTFWTSPVEVKESRGLADGDRIVIEAAKGGKYHVIDRLRVRLQKRHTRRDSVDPCSNYPMRPEMLKAWERFRESERKSPEYRPDPPETEDQGASEGDANDW